MWNSGLIFSSLKQASNCLIITESLGARTQSVVHSDEICSDYFGPHGIVVLFFHLLKIPPYI